MTAEDALAKAADCYVVCTNHDVFDYDAIVKQATLIVDTRNAFETAFVGQDLQALSP